MYNAMLKRTEVKIDGTSFFVAPFPVFAAVRITAMLSKVLAPVLGGLIALLGESADEEAEDDLGNEIKSAIPSFVEAMSSTNPADFERLFRELLVNSRNIAFQDDEHTTGEILTEDYLNAMFAGDSQNLYILAYHVLKVNFRGFFEKFSSLSGSPLIQKLKAQIDSPDTGDSRQSSSASSNLGATP